MKGSTEYSIINFAYFTANFTPNFIAKCWADDEHLINHLETKFMSEAKNGFMSIQGFMNFFFNLDRENQTKLVLWINENYSYTY
jgi:hypothetical protein